MFCFTNFTLLLSVFLCDISVIMPPKDKPVDKFCFWCKNLVIRASRCPGCNAPYHKECTLLIDRLENGAYAKCCKPRAASSTDIAVNLQTPGSSDSSLTATDVAKIVREVNKELFDQLSESFKNSLDSLKDSLTSKIDNALSMINHTDTKVNDLFDRVNHVEVCVGNFSEKLSTLPDVGNMVRSCAAEIEDRESRKKNIILFGLPETGISQNPGQCSDSDIKNAKDLLSLFSSATIIDSVKLIRLGSSSSVQDQHKLRPMKISCSTVDMAKQLHLDFLKIKRGENPPENLKEIWLVPDRTKLQLQELADLKKEMLSRRSKGERNLRMVYRHGIPFLTTHIQSKKVMNLAQESTTLQS